MNMSEAHEYINRIREKAKELNVTVTFVQDRKVFIHNSTEGHQRIRGLIIPTTEEKLVAAMNWVAHS